VHGLIARAAERFDMPVHGFLFLSNHYHLLVSPRDARHLAEFMRYLSGNLAREICRITGWSDKVWARRYAHVPIVGDAAQIARLGYVLSQGVKEGLVARALDWPGPSCVPALLDGSLRITGVWYDRTKAYRAARGAIELEPEDWITEETLVLTPLPALQHLSPEQYTETIHAMVHQIELEAAALDLPVLGADSVIKQSTDAEVPRKQRSPIPLVHAASVEMWKAFRDAYRSFVAAYREACELLRAGFRQVKFPPGSFAPSLGFVPH
jgi:putative transposase